MDALINLRAGVRAAALKAVRSKDPTCAAGTAAAREVLQLCDEFRDVTAPSLGYAVKDVNGSSVVRRD